MGNYGKIRSMKMRNSTRKTQPGGPAILSPVSPRPFLIQATNIPTRRRDFLTKE